MKYFVPAGRITNKGMPQRERKCFVVKKTVWKLFAPALCAAVLFAACSKDDSSSSRPQSVFNTACKLQRTAGKRIVAACKLQQRGVIGGGKQRAGVRLLPLRPPRPPRPRRAHAAALRYARTAACVCAHPPAKKAESCVDDPRRHAHRVHRLAERVGQNDLRGQNRLCLGSVLIV